MCNDTQASAKITKVESISADLIHRLAKPLFFCKANRWRAPQSTTSHNAPWPGVGRREQELGPCFLNM
jgi:hypothetical protein